MRCGWPIRWGPSASIRTRRAKRRPNPSGRPPRQSLRLCQGRPAPPNRPPRGPPHGQGPQALRSGKSSERNSPSGRAAGTASGPARRQDQRSVRPYPSRIETGPALQQALRCNRIGAATGPTLPGTWRAPVGLRPRLPIRTCAALLALFRHMPLGSRGRPSGGACALPKNRRKGMAPNAGHRRPGRIGPSVRTRRRDSRHFGAPGGGGDAASGAGQDDASVIVQGGKS